ncbi:hypothetical protein BH23VER1_BH23VER1_29100 [soil metagenome]
MTPFNRKQQLTASLLSVLGVASLPLTGGVTSTQAGDGYGYGGSISGIAEREMIRRQQNIAEADAAVAEGDKLVAEENYEGAIAEYRRALDLYPVAPITADRRDLATRRYAEASIGLARQRADDGDYAASRGLLQAVLSPEVDPDNKKAKALLEDLDDPEIWNPANSPGHMADVQEVEKHLNMALGQYDLGQFDAAKESLNSVLVVDRYNVAARRMLEKVDRHLSNTYYKSAYDQTRAKMMREVDELWESAVVTDSFDADALIGLDLPGGGEEVTMEKLRTIRIPSVQFEDATIQEAVEFLRLKSREMDVNTVNPEEKGVNILIREGGGAGVEGAVGGSISSRRITLSATDLPLGEALKYVTDLASLRYRVEPYAVVVVPATDSVFEFYTRVFRVPPTFLSGGGDDDGGAAAADPFATEAADTGGLKGRKTALEVLSGAGVTFPEGASAFYNRGTSQLTVRNTANNIDLISQYVEDLNRSVGTQVFITTKFVEVSQTNTDELGFDWLLGGFNTPGSDRVFGQGGTVGNAAAGPVSTADFSFVPPGSDVPVGSFPVSRGLRFGGDAISTGAIDGLLNAGAEVVSSSSPGIFALAGVFTDPQFQVVVRALSQKKGVDLMSAPSIVTKSGQRAKIEVIREFIYPIEFDPPEIPQNFGSSNLSGGFNPLTGVSNAGGVSSFPVTPTTPTAFDVRNTGVTLEVDPVVGPEGYTIDLNLAPEVIEFEGFINYGSPIQSGATNALGLATTVVLTENRIEQPIFSTRRAQTSVTIYDGRTVAIGGLIREDIQTVEDKVPFLGDIPFVGRLFRTDAENHFKRNLVIFVTARLIDPAGQPINQPSTEVTPLPSDPGPSTDLIPQDPFPLK